VLLAASALLAVGCAGSRREAVRATELPLEPPLVGADAERAAVVHLVTAGQTLWRIARAYEIELDDLARANGIDDPSAIRVGQRLVIPGATSPRPVPSYPQPVPPQGAPPARAHVETRASFSWPVAGGRILSGYGEPRRTHRHAGIDIGGRRGEPVCAAEEGRVVYAGSTLRGYGKTVIIDHGDDLRSLYAHNSELLVREGDRVGRGEVIARLGRTGRASTNHCHFEIRRHGVAVDPLLYVAPVTEDTR
jgi:hypothetical protein